MNIAARKQVRMVGLCAAVVAATVSVTGCSYVNPEATTLEYSGSDGLVEKIDDVSLNNILIVAKSEQDPGRVLGTVVNDSDQDITLELKTSETNAQIEVPADSETRLEDTDNQTLLEPAGAQPGEMVEVTFTTDGGSLTKSVPVLDHTFPRYAEYIPGGAPSTPGNPSNTPAPEGEEGGH